MRVLLSLSESLTESEWVLVTLTESQWVLVSLTESEWVLVSLTESQWVWVRVLLSLSESQWVLVSLSVVWVRCKLCVVDRTPDLLRQFVLDLQSGKLHREFHMGLDPVVSLSHVSLSCHSGSVLFSSTHCSTAGPQQPSWSAEADRFQAWVEEIRSSERSDGHSIVNVLYSRRRVCQTCMLKVESTSSGHVNWFVYCSGSKCS